MITRKQSDKICNCIIKEVDNRFIKPMFELSNAMQGIISKEKFGMSIRRKRTDTLYKRDTAVLVEGCDGVGKIRIYESSFEFSVKNKRGECSDGYVSMRLHGDLDINKVVDAIDDIVPVPCLADYFRKLHYYGEDSELTLKYLMAVKDHIFVALIGSVVKPFLTELDIAYKKFDSIVEFVRNQIELFSKNITAAYDLAMEKDIEDDAMVLSKFGLTPEAVEPENFEIKIKIEKVKDKKNTTKKKGAK